MKLQLEFIYRRRVPWVVIAACVLGAVACLSTIIEWQDLRAQHQRATQLLESQRRELKEEQRIAADRARNVDVGAAQRVKEQVAMLASLNRNWNQVLSPVEAGGDNEVALLGLAYSQATGVTQLQVEALSAGALVRYVENLNEDNEESEGTNLWYLSTYQAQPQNSPPTVKGTILQKR